MQKINGLKISLCQMKVVPGRPDINAEYIICEINSAKDRKIDIIVFPEMCTTGYLIGDMFEDSGFLEDVMRFNEKIIEATRGKGSARNGIIAIFGTPVVDSSKRGEDGRPRTYNAAIVAQDGELITRGGPFSTVKSLQPNYRFFNDDKHFYNLRKVAEASGEPLGNFLCPVSVATSIGIVKVGVILCEDMWDADYFYKPVRELVQRGAEIIFNLSASPWGWQKNRKRHQVVRDLLKDCPVPFVYINNTGVQNPGKNIVMFDGSSTVYNRKGEIVFEISPYIEGAHYFTFNETLKPLSERLQNDSKELYDAMIAGIKFMVPSWAEKIIIGLSGGIDSAVVAALIIDIFGPERVIGVNMPFRDYNSQTSKDVARQTAENLGIQYLVRPIDDVVRALAGDDIREDDFEYENIQATARMTVLSKLAKKYHGVFTCNSNKVEMAFGYSTLYGDLAGFYAPLGDSVKREVRQIANYQNRERFKREVIPMECINAIPTAGLRPNQVDPFDYGDLNRRGYHDEMVRAFTEFRKNPEWFLKQYIMGTLESELKLEPETLARLFPTAQDFVKDLRRCWDLFHGSYFKRIQSPPIPVYSKRAFGRDLEESIVTAHFTRRYLHLEKSILSHSSTPLTTGKESREPSEKPKIAVYGSGVNPPSKNHEFIVSRLTELFDTVIIVPRGIGTKPSLTDVAAHHRKAMTLLAFEDINPAKIRFDFYDLENNVFTPTYLLQERYSRQFPGAEVYFAIGGDLVTGGCDGNSEIQREWKRGENVWQDLKFAVISHPGLRVDPVDLPPNSMIVEIKASIQGRSTLIRERVSRGESIEDLVRPKVALYIKEYKLYE